MSNIQSYEKGKRITVVTNSAGQIIAAIPFVQATGAEVGAQQGQFRVGVKPLPGQTVHVIEIPEEFFRLDSAVSKHEWLLRHQIMFDPEPRIVRKWDR